MLFFGTEEFSASILEILLDNNFEIDTIVTKPDAPSGRGHKLTFPAVKVLAEKHGLRVLQPTNLLDIIDEMRGDSAILASYGKIVPQAILDKFTLGIINVHPSLLPRYRGASPIESAILNGDEETGVSLMKLVAEMDAGPVYIQQTVGINGSDTTETLTDKLIKVTKHLLVTHLQSILNGTLQPKPQEGEPTFCGKIDKKDGIIDWNKSAKAIERQIRAYHHWPQSRTTLGKVDVIITEAHAVPTNSGDPGHLDIVDDISTLMVDTAVGSLCIDKLKPLGKKEMPVKAFLQGYRSQL